ncbi:MAG: glycoside hydrolase family 1 protein, partial [Candidatus Riflebacteria bacterium]|nr:glycoside hydrolase family 1 protein [Candidatus Riflebacteria bacterium]
GSATAAHQVEGNNTNSDWWAWEQVPGHIRNNDRSGLADNHYQLFGQDLALARQMRHNAYRFSVEWARLEPEAGRFDARELAHYRAVLEACKSNGLAPVVTLFHFTLPQWLAQRGGWANPETVQAFERFAAHVGAGLGDLTDYWCTLNEPVVYLGAGYGRGVFPPQHANWGEARKTMTNLAKGHVAAFQALKRTDRRDADGDGGACLVSIAHHMRVFDPARPLHPLDVAAARTADYLFNKAFLKAITREKLIITAPNLPVVAESIPGGRGCLDFLGVNYYSRDLIQFDLKAPGFIRQTLPPGAATNDLAWEIYPEGFYRVLMSAWRDWKLPIMVTENGIADAADSRRPEFIRRHLQEMARAMRAGVPVIGYMHWSLMDNFEWAEGFAPRFGLLAVDYATQARKPTAGARVYSEVIEKGALELPEDTGE